VRFLPNGKSDIRLSAERYLPYRASDILPIGKVVVVLPNGEQSDIFAKAKVIFALACE
jgi:hypothetical protein